MLIRKSVYLISSLVASQMAFAQESNKETATSKLNLDILGGFGFSNYSGMNRDNNKANIKDSSMSGFNVNASALYSLFETSIGSPVVGGGINYSRLTGENDKVNIIKIEGTFSTLALMANAGFKFKPSEKFAIFTLGNFGYGVYSDLDFKVSQNTNINYAIDSTIKNHFIYGASVIGTYEVAQNFSIGAGLTYNRHSYKNDRKEKANGIVTSSDSSNWSLNEVSANLTASYSL